MIELSFESCDFGKSINLKGRYIDKLNLKECSFSDKVNFSHLKNDSNELQLNLIDCQFEKNVRFHRLHLGVCDFENSTFNGVADFWEAKFKKSTSFYKTTFSDNVVFSKAEFERATNFKFTTFRAIGIFRDAKFKNGINLAHANFTFQSSLSTHELDTGKFSGKDISLSDQRETFRILKNDAIQSNNKIGSLEYYAKEMQAYHKLVRSKYSFTIQGIVKKLNYLHLLWLLMFLPSYFLLSLSILVPLFIVLFIASFFVPILFKKKALKSLSFSVRGLYKREFYLPKQLTGDWWILFVQRIFGNYNQSWGLSLAATLIIAFFLFVGYNFTLEEPVFEFGLDSWTSWDSWKSWGFVISDYLLFLWPGREFDAISKSPGALKIGFDIISRVFIGIGLYQTLRSFRKLG